MKLKILLLAIILALLFMKPSQAQRYSHSIANRPGNTVEFVLARSPITIKGYNGDKLIVKNSDYHAPPKRAEGLHPVFGGGKDNSGIGLSVHQQSGGVKLVQAQAGAGDFTVKVPNNVRVKIEEINWGGGDIHISNMKGEIEIKAKTGDIKLQNVTGPVIANSTNGNINVTFSQLSGATPSSISLVSGHMNVNLPADAKVNLNMSTVSGQIYTDFDIKMEDKKGRIRQVGGRNTESTLNGGGVKLNLKTITGNIYLRKKK